MTGAYAFLLLALAVQAENTFEGYNDTRSEEVEALLTNVKVILAGLEAYGTVWPGIDAMAGECNSPLEERPEETRTDSTSICQAKSGRPWKQLQGCLSRFKTSRISRTERLPSRSKDVAPTTHE